MKIEDESDSFEYEGGVVRPGQTAKFEHQVGEWYLGDPVDMPVTIVNGSKPGPTVFLSAAIHGDELNGVEVVRRVVDEWDHEEIHGCLVGLPVLNVPGFTTQQRYLPVTDRDLNRAFPGDPDSTSAHRIAYHIYENFIQPCDFGLDFHTSTRGRTNMFHIRADMDTEETARLARAFGANVILDGEGQEGTLRREATENGIPTITIEMGEARRFEQSCIDEAFRGVRSIFAEYGIYPDEVVRWPGWRTIVEGWGERTWLRSNSGGIVDMRKERGELVHEGEIICRITSPFKRGTDTIRAPFTGLLVGILKNPVVFPGNPLVHLAEVENVTAEVIEKYGIEPLCDEPVRRDEGEPPPSGES
ncbi:succinylglutamate desuccinylase/aspartoacylase family protein [Halanaeroarchaeum sulfurireducens]|uniref:Succinylglutamate desuccinylase/aspartoacylase n=1 Tax=Halanaeroarchaeum sulfurireducens TaxID=1604004 RepID=A0A0F7PE48_9EURY|nr:succinylglutamate desuccinylase/aspartoacylase family protein [Halanaeroarchaeum sulfurireducens]AKH97613.1 succinylglutamate desuccinylase/aspartoacylase [Halanaeroarchaeum sulfurireducens]ALG82009.1 succinylglutamate desuccinylase/aspartoacylase [Halanaeroarchaeum sulfurireducens]